MTALVDQVQARVADQVAALRSVGAAAELADLIGRKSLPAVPAAFALPLGFDAGPNDLAAGGHRQDLGETVGLLLVHRVAGDSTGAKAVTALSALIGSAIAAVAGWTPEVPDGGEAGSVEPFDLVRGRLHGLTAAGVFYQLDFRARWTVRGS